MVVIATHRNIRIASKSISGVGQKRHQDEVWVSFSMRRHRVDEAPSDTNVGIFTDGLGIWNWFDTCEGGFLGLRRLLLSAARGRLRSSGRAPIRRNTQPPGSSLRRGIPHRL